MAASAQTIEKAESMVLKQKEKEEMKPPSASVDSDRVTKPLEDGGDLDLQFAAFGRPVKRRTTQPSQPSRSSSYRNPANLAMPSSAAGGGPGSSEECMEAESPAEIEQEKGRRKIQQKAKAAAKAKADPKLQRKKQEVEVNIAKAKDVWNSKSCILDDESMWTSKPKKRTVDGAVKSMDDAATKLLGVSDPAVVSLVTDMMNLSERAGNKNQLFIEIRKRPIDFVAHMKDSEYQLLQAVDAHCLSCIFVHVGNAVLKELESNSEAGGAWVLGSWVDSDS